MTAAPGARAAPDRLRTRGASAGLALALVVVVAACARPAYVPRDGDIVFHTSRSAQSLAIQKATRSPYSHMGLVFHRDGVPYVFEAVEPVRWTKLADWTARGAGGRFVAKRLVDAEQRLDAAALQALRRAATRYLGRHYDLYFEWSDERIYCSELVWKAYRAALGIELGARQTLAEFDLTDPAVQAKIRERWPHGPPAQELVISPAAIYAADQLIEVYAN